MTEAETQPLEYAYTAIVSPGSIKAGREEAWPNLLDLKIPDNWKRYGGHMTINLGKAKQSNMVGKKINIVVDRFAKDERVIAVGVKPESLRNLKVETKTPHITIATGPSGKPFMSNKLSNWETLPNPISLEGVIAEVTPAGEIITDQMKKDEDERLNKLKADKDAKAAKAASDRKAQNEMLKQMGYDAAFEYLQQQHPNLPDRAIEGKLKGAGLTKQARGDN